MPKAKKKPALVEVHARLFEEDVVTLQRIAAEKGISYQIELRALVRRALKGYDLAVLKERP